MGVFRMALSAKTKKNWLALQRLKRKKLKRKSP
jgi:hypothetical protein